MAKKQQPKQKVEKKQEENAPVEILPESGNDQRTNNNNEVPANMSGRRLMKQQMKRTMWFICVYAVIALIISAVLIVYTNIPQWLNMLVIVVIAGVFYLLFLWICAIIDKKKAEKQQQNPKDDPFSE